MVLNIFCMLVPLIQTFTKTNSLQLYYSETCL